MNLDTTRTYLSLCWFCLSKISEILWDSCRSWSMLWPSACYLLSNSRTDNGNANHEGN